MYKTNLKILLTRFSPLQWRGALEATIGGWAFTQFAFRNGFKPPPWQNIWTEERKSFNSREATCSPSARTTSATADRSPPPRPPSSSSSSSPPCLPGLLQYNCDKCAQSLVDSFDVKTVNIFHTHLSLQLILLYHGFIHNFPQRHC